MKNLLLFMFALAFGMPMYAQLNCSNVHAVMSLSASGGTVTLTNSSTPVSTSTIYTYYTIKWGDNSTTYAYNSNSAQTHTYNTSGTYTVTLYSSVLDSINNIHCYDTASANITVTTSLNCSNVLAAMNAYVSGGVNGVVNNLSTPVGASGLAVQYMVKWGDGNTLNTSTKGSYSHTYTTGGSYVVKLFITVHDSNNNITCMDSTSSTLNISGSTLNCGAVQAAFYKTVSGATVTTINNSSPNPGSGVNATYKFYWGDNTSTTKTSKSNTSHTYSATGTYTIKLIAYYTDSFKTCVDSTSDTINVIVVVPNVISGNIYVDSTSQLDSYKVWLITFDAQTNILAAVDSQTVGVFAGYGYYSFSNKAAATYRTKAALQNGPTSGTGYIPTYHDSDLLWSNANLITHTGGTTSGKNIYVRKGTITSGPGFVGGNVSQGANKGTANGIEGVNILLLDANDNAVTYTVTDAHGDYNFPALPNGNYKVHPEYIGFTTTPVSLSITAGQSSLTAINFERSLSMKTIVPVAAGVNGVNNAKLDFAVYPNPAKNRVTINWASYSEQSATVTITDISGKKVLNTEVKMNGNSVINIDALHTGFYFLNVANDMGNSTQKLIVQ